MKRCHAGATRAAPGSMHTGHVTRLCTQGHPPPHPSGRAGAWDGGSWAHSACPPCQPCTDPARRGRCTYPPHVLVHPHSTAWGSNQACCCEGAAAPTPAPMPVGSTRPPLQCSVRRCHTWHNTTCDGTNPLSGVESRQLLIQVQQQGNGLRTTYRYNLWPQDWAVMLMYLCFFTGLWLCCSRLVGKGGWPGQPLNSGRRHIGAFTPPQPCLGLLRGSQP
jgi:hypothetical protein